MIYEYIPNKDPRRVTGLLVILIAAAVGFFLFPSMFPALPLSWVFQMSGTLCLVAAIFTYTRYMGMTYIYRIIENDEGGLDLTVTEVTGGGRSRITVCRFDLADVEDVYAITETVEDQKRAKADMERRAKRERRKRFDYCAEMLATDALYVFATVSGEKLCIKLSPDGRLFTYFAEAIDKRGGQ